MAFVDERLGGGAFGLLLAFADDAAEVGEELGVLLFGEELLPGKGTYTGVYSREPDGAWIVYIRDAPSLWYDDAATGESDCTGDAVSSDLVNAWRVDASAPIGNAHLLARSRGRTMAYWKVKPNMHGTGGGRWGTREEAKHFANKVRRRDDGAEVRAGAEEEPDRGPRLGASRFRCR